MVEGESLCRTCRFAHIQRGFRQNEEMTYCGYDTMRLVRFKVADCTDYLDKTIPTRFEMEQMAYLIKVEPARTMAGFERVGFSVEKSANVGKFENEDGD